MRMLITRSETQEELPGMELGSISKMSGKRTLEQLTRMDYGLPRMLSHRTRDV